MQQAGLCPYACSGTGVYGDYTGLLAVAGDEADACELAAVLTTHRGNEQGDPRQGELIRCQPGQPPASAKCNPLLPILPQELKQSVSPGFPLYGIAVVE